MTSDIRELSDNELEKLLTDLESDRVERKASFQGNVPDTVRKTICAFSNNLTNSKELGVIFIGADDNGYPSGLKITDELIR